MIRINRLVIGMIFLLTCPTLIMAITKEDIKFQKSTRVVLRKHCVSCHNEADKKAGINLDAFDFVSQIIRRGELFENVIEQSMSGAMPPAGKPRMNVAEMDSLVIGIRRILDEALAQPDPGESIMRRLSHREYTYTIQDLVGVTFDAIGFFPTEGSGGEGFDNQSRVLFITPLMMERYYTAADSIISMASQNINSWNQIFTEDYKPTFFRKLWSSLQKIISNQPIHWEQPRKVAKKILLPFATKAYRRFLSTDEQDQLLDFFEKIYFQNWKDRKAFNKAIQASLKSMLISPHFLYRFEVNLPSEQPYAINNFELATRLSYLLWSSTPDETLLNVAYRENLQDPEVLRREALRLMEDEKFKRFSKSFAPQWLGIEELLHSPKSDPIQFPEMDESLRFAMVQEVVELFQYAFEQRNLISLLDSDYTIINERLAKHYDLIGIKGDHFRPVEHRDNTRGGILGTAAVLTSTSLPLRTSPVLRGQWVLDEILGEPAAPPPPDVPALEVAKSKVHNELDLRALLEQHREAPECSGCHQKMDPLGLSLENFDAIGRWRSHYTDPLMDNPEITISFAPVKIDASGKIDDVKINGPQEMRMYLLSEKDKFAKTFSKKLLSYALGRGVEFLDSPSINQLTETLLVTNFDSQELMIQLILSYPFRHRRSDSALKYLTS